MPARILVSPNAFKGTLAPSQAAQIIKSELKKFIPSKNIFVCPLADGGDGTLDVLMSTFKGRIQTSRVRGPLGKPVLACWGIVRFAGKKTAIIEMAQASGLALVKGKNKILQATSFGTGQLIKAALDKGCRQILIGVGGTATSDGGSGALQALGLHYYDKKKKILSAKPKDLMKLSFINWENFDARIKKTNIVILCDVKNSLLGPTGSARTFGPQKGANRKEVRLLEKFLRHWSQFSLKQTKNQAGAGAAGALAFGLSGFAGGHLVQGAPFILKSLKWRKAARRCNVIVTGEGRLDTTSFQGKVVGTILKNRGKSKVGIICGATSLSKTAVKRKKIQFLLEMGPAGLRFPKKALQKAVKQLKTHKALKI